MTLFPSALSFNGQSGAALASQNLIVNSSTGTPVNFTAAAYSSGGWLTVTPTSGATPASLAVAANPGGLGTGAYGGFITITTQSGTTTVPVTLNLNSSGSASPIAVTPGSLTYQFGPNSTLPINQTLTINSTAALGGPVTVSTATSNGGSFLAVNPSSVSVSPGSPGSFSVSVNPTGLGPGIYNAVIALNPPGTTGAIVPVLVNVTGPGTVNVSPTLLNFAWQTGTNVPAAQTVAVTSSGTSPQSFSAVPVATTCGANWLVVSPQTSATPTNLTVQVNPTGLQPGACTGRIDITAAGATNPTQSIPVNLLVTNNPLLQVPTAGPTFNFLLNSGTIPAAQSIPITSSGTALPYTVAVTPVGNGPNFLAVTPTSGNTPGSLSLALNPSVVSGLAPNTYVVNVTVSSPGSGNPAQTFPVTLVVSNNAVLVPTQPSATFNFQVGQAAPASQVLTLASTGIPLNYTVSTVANNCPGFFSVTPTSGSTGNQFGNSTQLVITANTAGLTAAQTCTGSITLSVPGSSNPGLTIPVTLNVATNALINVSVPSINATAIAGQNQLQQQFVSVTSTDPNATQQFVAVASTTPAGLTWLRVAPNTGSTPSVLSVVLDPTNLAPGVYQGSIAVSANSASVPSQIVPVTLTVASAQIAAAPTSLNFTQAVNGPAPATQSFTITGLPQGTTIGATATMFNGAGWLSVTPGNTAGTVNVSVNGAALSQGIYQGVVTVIAPGATPNPLYLPVTLSVGNPLSFVLSGTNAGFNFQTGSSTLPDAQIITINNTGGVAVPFTATVATSNGGNFLTVTPTSGATPGQISIGLNQAVASTLAPGTYNGTITLSSPNIPGGNQVINVQLVVAPRSAPAVTTIVNAASNQPGPVVPGQLVTLYGTNIGPATPAFLKLTSEGRVATSLTNTTVTFDGIPAPLIYAGPGQINAIVPYEIAGRATTDVVVRTGSQSSSTIRLQVAATAPAIFTLNQTGSGPGAIRNQDASINGALNPAAKGSVVSLWATGAGQTVPGGTTGAVTPSTPPFARPVGDVSVTIGGVPAEVTFFGAAPALVSGALQVNVRIPEGVGSGSQPIVLKVGDNQSQPVVTVFVQ